VYKKEIAIGIRLSETFKEAFEVNQEMSFLTIEISLLKTLCVAITSIIFLTISTTKSHAQNGKKTTDWPTFRGSPQLTGVAQTSLPEQPEVLWTFQAKDMIEAPAVISNGTVYCASLDSNLYALDLKTGDLKWQYPTLAGFKAAPSVSKNTVFLGDEMGDFYAVDALSGKLKWKFRTDGEIMSAANFYDNRVLFGSYDNFLYCLNAGSGELVWKFETAGYVNGMPAIFDGKAVIAGCDGMLRVFKIEDGSEISEAPAGGYVAAGVAIKNKRGYFGNFENQFLCYDLEKAELLWVYMHPKRRFPFYASAAVTDSLVVVGGRDKMLHAIDPQTGKVRWTFRTRAKIDSSPVIAGKRVYFGVASGKVFGLELASGEAVWEYDTGAGVVASPAIAHGRLVIGNDDGVLFCFGEK
jgi:outer membrane protein assembly factor BamB